MALTPVLTAHWDEPDAFTIAGYRRHGGYEMVGKVLGADPDRLIQVVKDSGLRGRGGAGFPTGLKWSFVPQNDDKDHYLVVNADESEPGACKDIPLMIANPHAVVEGCILAAHAIRARRCFIYIRGEVPQAVRRVRAAVGEAYAAGFLGRDVLGTGIDVDIDVHAGAGAYICGEETALLDSLEGRRGQPRLKPPFPAVAGLYARPTVVNNVETIANIPTIARNGAEWLRQMGTEKSPGFKLFSVSGHVNRPGVFECALGTTMRELLDYAGGVRDGHELKFWVPGGSSVPLLMPEHLDVPMTYEDMQAAGTMLGTATVMVFDETTSVVRAISRWIHFYKHESCGKCTPCREGTYWLEQLLADFELGRAAQGDIAKVDEVCKQMFGRNFCPLGDAAATPYAPALKYFRSEFEAGTHTPAHELFDPLASAVFTPSTVGAAP